MPKISITTKKPTQASIKSFQESIQFQAMSITTCDHNLGFLGILLRASNSDPLHNRKPFAPPTDLGPAPVNAIVTAAQISDSTNTTKKFTTYCKLHIVLISVITNSCPEQYMTTLKHRITKFFQCGPITLLSLIYT